MIKTLLAFIIVLYYNEKWFSVVITTKIKKDKNL